MKYFLRRVNLYSDLAVQLHNYCELHVNLTCFILVALKVSLFHPLTNSHTEVQTHGEDILKC